MWICEQNVSSQPDQLEAELLEAELHPCNIQITLCELCTVDVPVCKSCIQLAVSYCALEMLQTLQLQNNSFKHCMRTILWVTATNKT